MSYGANKTERGQSLMLDVSARVFPSKTCTMEKGSTLAYASADIGGCFTVTGIRVVQGKNGPFVAMPSQLGKDNQYHDVCFPTTAAMREVLNTVVMETYYDALERQAALAMQASGRRFEQRPTPSMQDTRSMQTAERYSEQRFAKTSVRGALNRAINDVAARPASAPARTPDRWGR